MLEIVFFTSSKIKLAHARYLCRAYDVLITGFREKTFGANYVEPRIDDREKLLEESYQDALQRWLKSYPSGEGKLFILEDTSVVIDALSTEKETPGLDVKYWMAETDFATLNTQLKKLGNNRKALVRSDLILHLPRALRTAEDSKSYRCFTSFAEGNIVEEEQKFETNALYPWLDNKTFNKWFVPNGCLYPISRLSIDEADRHDFRAQAFREMLKCLLSHKIIGLRRHSEIQKKLKNEIPLFVICGPSCAGKTTLAEHLAKKYGYYHIEASDFMYLSYYQRHNISAVIKIGDFAEQALRDKPEIVAEQVLQDISQNPGVPIVITGFRSPLELEWFYQHYDGDNTIEFIFVTADLEIRFERSISRGRDDQPRDHADFEQRDVQQARMGLAELQRKAEKILKNDKNLNDFFENFDNQFVEVPLCELHYIPNLKASSLEKLILLTLTDERESQKYFTTTEIAHLINQKFNNGNPKNKNNISRYFNQRFYPYFEIKLINGKIKYRLSNTGFGKAYLLAKFSQAARIGAR